MDNSIFSVLIELRKVLLQGGYIEYSELIDELLAHVNDVTNEFWELSNSNKIWGGAGSIADQAFCMGSVEEKRKFGELMTAFGEMLIQENRASNVHIRDWVQFFN